MVLWTHLEPFREPLKTAKEPFFLRVYAKVWPRHIEKRKSTDEFNPINFYNYISRKSSNIFSNFPINTLLSFLRRRIMHCVSFILTRAYFKVNLGQKNGGAWYCYQECSRNAYINMLPHVIYFRWLILGMGGGKKIRYSLSKKSLYSLYFHSLVSDVSDHFFWSKYPRFHSLSSEFSLYWS